MKIAIITGRSICVSDFLDTANSAAGPKHNLVFGKLTDT